MHGEREELHHAEGDRELRPHVHRAVCLAALAAPSAARAAPFAYITNRGADTVSVIDLASNTVIATVRAGRFPDGVAVAPDGKRVYVTNWLSSSVLVISTAIYTVIATIRVGFEPLGIDVTSDSSRVYVANWFSRRKP